MLFDNLAFSSFSLFHFKKAGWVPYWALSSSILNAGSSDRTDEIKSEFRLSARGNVTVRTPGLYYVYSQVILFHLIYFEQCYNIFHISLVTRQSISLPSLKNSFPTRHKYSKPSRDLSSHI